MPACIDLSGDKSIARVTLATMSAANKEAVDVQIEKTMKGKINREVKGTILNIAHRELLELKNIEHLTKSVVELDEMIHTLKPTMEELIRTDHAMKVGDWVEVLCEYAPGTCSDGGVGEIVKITRDDNDRAWCTVAYVLDKRIETGIDQSRITVTIMPWKDTTSKKREGRVVNPMENEEVEERKYEPPNRTPIEWLQYGLKSRTHERRGWLKDKLLKCGLLEATPEALWKRIMSDHKCQLAAIEGMKMAMGDAFVDPREYKGNNGEKGKFVTKKKETQLDVPKNFWTIPYILYAYDVKRSNFHNKRKADKNEFNLIRVTALSQTEWLHAVTTALVIFFNIEGSSRQHPCFQRRCYELHKMPLRNSYHSSRDPTTGKLSFKGNAVKNVKGVPYLVDCAVTGTDVGTATKPCFPLKRLWEC
jgi:hypothetical protein